MGGYLSNLKPKIIKKLNLHYFKPTEEDILQPEQPLSFKTKILSNHWLSFEKNEIFLLISFFFLGGAFANYEPYAPFWLQDLFSVESFLIIGLVTIIPSIAVAVGTSFWGYFADRFGIKKFVLLGIISYCFLFFSLIFTSNATYFLVAVLIGSMLGAAQSSNFYALGEKIVEKPRTVIFAKMIGAISLSWVILSPIVGWIGDRYEAEPLVAMKIQLIIAVVFCVNSLVIASFIQEKNQIKNEIEENLKLSEKRNLTYFPYLFTVMMIVVFTWEMTGGFWAFISIYFLDVLVIPRTIYGVYLIIKTALAIPLSYLLGRVKKHSKNTLIMIMFGTWSVIMFFFMMMFPENWLMILLLYGIPMYPLYSVTYQNILSDLTPKERRATAFGIMSTIRTFGYICSILLLGFIADKLVKGIFTMLIASFVFSVIALAFILVFYVMNRLNKAALRSTEFL